MRCVRIANVPLGAGAGMYESTHHGVLLALFLDCPTVVHGMILLAHRHFTTLHSKRVFHVIEFAAAPMRCEQEADKFTGKPRTCVRLTYAEEHGVAP